VSSTAQKVSICAKGAFMIVTEIVRKRPVSSHFYAFIGNFSNLWMRYKQYKDV